MRSSSSELGTSTWGAEATRPQRGRRCRSCHPSWHASWDAGHDVWEEQTRGLHLRPLSWSNGQMQRSAWRASRMQPKLRVQGTTFSFSSLFHLPYLLKLPSISITTSLALALVVVDAAAAAVGSAVSFTTFLGRRRGSSSSSSSSTSSETSSSSCGTSPAFSHQQCP